MQYLGTHTTIKRFIARGMSEELAEEIVSAIEEAKDHSHLVTKDDLRIAVSDLKNEIKEVRNEIKESKHDMLKWIMPCFITIIALLIGICIKILA